MERQVMKNVIYLSFFFTTVTFAQSNSSEKKNELSFYIMNSSWVELPRNTEIKPHDIFMQNHSLFGLEEDDEMRKIKTVVDEMGITHSRYQQFYKGIKVEGAEYVIHSKNDLVQRINGKIARNLSFEKAPLIKKSTALKTAFKELEFNNLKETLNTENLIYELVFAHISVENEFISKGFYLAHKFSIFSQKNEETNIIYIDAQNGIVLKKESNTRSCEVGNAKTAYYGIREFNTRKRGFPNYDYVLEDRCRGDGIITGIDKSNVDDKDNDWTSSEQRPAITTHWAMQKTYDYYKENHNRLSFDGSSAEIISRTKVKIGNTDFNAAYSPGEKQQDASDDVFKFGKANGTDGYNSLDIVGHEFTHGVIEFESALGIDGEPGALAESFGDIFGEMVENFALEHCDYIHASEIGGGNRSLIQPKDFNHPNTFEGENWINPSEEDNDRGGIHTNCGVQNYWFYLLSEGGSGFIDDNSSNPPYNVDGIGRYSAIKIAYRSLKYYLTSTSNFSDAKNGAIWAAMDLFGNCSEEVIQTINAWNAVGVYSNQEENSILNGYNLLVDCPALKVLHEGSPPLTSPQPLTLRALNNLESNCSITANNYPVTFIAGNKISLSNGFKSGNNFRASIMPCLTSASKKSSHTNNSIKTINIDKEFSTMFIKEEEPTTQQQITIYPNPNSSGLFNVQLTENTKQLNATVYNIMGAKVLQQPLHSTNEQINLNHQPKGLYIIEIASKEGVFYREKLVYQ